MMSRLSMTMFSDGWSKIGSFSLAMLMGTMESFV